MEGRLLPSLLLLLATTTVDSRTTSLGGRLPPSFISCLQDSGKDSFLHVYSPDPTSVYNTLNYQWELLQPVRYPAAYYLPTTVQDIQSIVICSKLNGVRILPKGGGHSYMKCSYGDEDTVIIDMQKLDSLTVNAKSSQFKIGAGALLAQLAWPLYSNYGLVTPHGTCPTVGIAGLALGGGYGYLSRLYGLTTDSILEVEMVSADGDLWTISPTSNADLYWALKGSGAGSYGIITKFTMKAYKAPREIVFGVATYPLDTYVQVFSAWQRLVLSQPPDEINTKLSIKNNHITIEIFEIQLEEGFLGLGFENVRQYFEQFPPIEVKYNNYDYPEFMMKTMHAEAYGVQRPEDFVHLTRHSQTPKRFKAKSFFVSQQVGDNDMTAINSVLQSIPSPQDIIIEYYAFGGAINKPEHVGHSSFMHRAQSMYLVQAFYEYRPGPVNLLDVDTCLAWLRQYYDVSKSIMHTTGSYQNYGDGELDDWASRYFGWNFERLMQIKREVDPRNAFRHPQSVPLWY